MGGSNAKYICIKALLEKHGKPNTCECFLCRRERLLATDKRSAVVLICGWVLGVCLVLWLLKLFGV